MNGFEKIFRNYRKFKFNELEKTIQRDNNFKEVESEIKSNFDENKEDLREFFTYLTNHPNG